MTQSKVCRRYAQTLNLNSDKKGLEHLLSLNEQVFIVLDQSLLVQPMTSLATRMHLIPTSDDQHPTSLMAHLQQFFQVRHSTQSAKISSRFSFKNSLV